MNDSDEDLFQDSDENEEDLCTESSWESESDNDDEDDKNELIMKGSTEVKIDTLSEEAYEDEAEVYRNHLKQKEQRN